MSDQGSQDSFSESTQSIPDDKATMAPQEGPEESNDTNFEKERQNWLVEKDALQKEISDLKDQYLRSRAEFENYRKRVQKEREDERKNSNSQILGDLVTILDDFERAIKSSQISQDFQSFNSGIQMIETQMVQMLEKKYGLKRFDSIGAPFNPEHHEAVAMLPPMEDSEDSEMTVVEEYQKGYHLHERILRTAKVKVGPKIASKKTEE